MVALRATVLSGTLPCGLVRRTGETHGPGAVARVPAKAPPASMPLGTWSALLPGTVRVRLEVLRAADALARGPPGAAAYRPASLCTTALSQTGRPRGSRASRVPAALVARPSWHAWRRDDARRLDEAQ